MEWIVTAREMKYCDTNTIEYFGVPSLVLMERAALKTVEFIEQKNYSLRKTLIVCGTGNNGGDGLAVARLLFLKGCAVEVLVMGDKKHFSKEAKNQYEICLQYHVPMIDQLLAEDYSLVIDALFGIGLGRNIEAAYAEVIDRVNQMQAVCRRVLQPIPEVSWVLHFVPMPPLRLVTAKQDRYFIRAANMWESFVWRISGSVHPAGWTRSRAWRHWKPKI